MEAIKRREKSVEIRAFAKNKLKETEEGQHYLFLIRRLREKGELLLESDIQYIRHNYKNRFGEDIDLVNPETFGAKLQWLKLFYRDPDMPICSDKYRIREFLAKKDLEWLSNEVIGVYKNANDIPFDMLPEQFAAKATHGSGWNLICEDKTALNWKAQTRIMNDWLKCNLYVFGREWNYREIEPRIIVEKYIDHKPLNDYKLMCFNGEPCYMQLNNDYEGTHYVDFYDLETWTHLPVTFMHYDRSDRDLEEPANLERMKSIARELSAQFPFVRVDFYSFDETIILGELTFFPGGGLWPFLPREEGYDKIIGDCLILPEPNHNLELYNQLHSEKNKV